MTGAPIQDADVTDLFVDNVYRTSQTGLVGLWVFQSRHDSAAVRVHKTGYRDTAFVVIVVARDSTPVPIFLHPAARVSADEPTATDDVGIIAGVVTSDSVAVAGATITAVDVKHTVFTNVRGEFRLPSMPPGPHVLEIRRVGYAPVRDSIMLPANAGVALPVRLERLPLFLDSMLVRSTRPSLLADFESRRKTGFGHFIDSLELRLHADDHVFPTYLASHLPGLRVNVKKAINQPTYLSSSRATCSGKAFTCSGTNACLISLFIDGIPAYIPGLTPGDAPDMDDFQAQDFAAVEWYSSGATAPAEFNPTGSKCGVMLLWRRR